MGSVCPQCHGNVPDGVMVCPRDGTPIGTLMTDPLLGVVLGGRYLLRECLGDRAGLRVYAGEEQPSGRPVLATLTDREIPADTFERFRKLAESLSALEHPSCAGIKDFGRTPPGVLFLIEQGEVWHRLSEELELKGKLGVSVALDLAIQLAEGLDYLHGQGVVHGSLSSGSLRLAFGEDGALRLEVPVSDIPVQLLDPSGRAGRADPTQDRPSAMVADIRAVAQILGEMLVGPKAMAAAQGRAPALDGLGLEGDQLERVTAVFDKGLGLATVGYHTTGELLRDLQVLAGRTRFGRYHLLRQIGRGGMGEVYLARAEGIEGIDFDRLCVIKTIRTLLANDPKFVERFLSEARVLASLTHGNIVPVYDVGKVGTTFYIAMQYVAGKDVRQILARAASLSRRVPVPLALFIARELANGLAYAHRARVQGQKGGLVHRDVSPHNVLVSYEGEVRLIDFGLVQGAKGTPMPEAGVVVGKLGYLSPEQALASPLDQRTDIYSAGLVLFELLTGQAFVKEGTVKEMLVQVSSPMLEPPSARAEGIPPLVDRLCLKAMAASRDERYGTAAELRDDLAAALARIAPRTNPEEVGAFVRQLFQREQVEEERLLSDLSITLPPASPSTPSREQSSSALSLLGRTPTPIQLDGAVSAALDDTAPVAASPPVEVRPPVVAIPATFTESVTAIPAIRTTSWTTVAVAALTVVAGIALLVAMFSHWRSEKQRQQAIRRGEIATRFEVLTKGALARPDAAPAPDARAAIAARVPGAPPRRPRPPRRPAPPEERPRPCRLIIVGGPAGAALLVNGEPRGHLPVKGPVELEPDTDQRIEIAKPGLLPFRTRLTCRPGEAVRVKTGVK